VSIAKSPRLGVGHVEQHAIKRNPEQLDPNRREVVFWEARNPKSVMNLVSPKLAECMRVLPQDFLGMSEKALRKKLDPGWVDEQLRIAFWDEYFLTVDTNGSRMRMEAVYARVCAKDVFYDRVANPLALAYICKPPQDYLYQMRSLLNLGLERFAEVLQLPLEHEGRVDTRLIAEIVKIVTIVDNRVKGAVTQKFQIDSTSKSVNLNVDYEAPKTHQDIQKELKDIEKEIKSLQSPQSSLNLFNPEESAEEVSEEINDERDPTVIDVSASSTET
jgi:hypothetical protein